MCFRPEPSVSAPITLPSANRPLLMVTPSANCCPVVPVSFARSLPGPHHHAQQLPLLGKMTMLHTFPVHHSCVACMAHIELLMKMTRKTASRSFEGGPCVLLLLQS